MGPGDTLTPLGDVIGIPPPIGAVISIGDVLLYAGIAILVVAVMLGRSGENPRPRLRCSRGIGGSTSLRIAASPVWRLSPSGLGSAVIPGGSGGGSCWRSDFGNRTVIVAPSPGALSTSKRPPPTCARSRIIAMPK